MRRAASSPTPRTRRVNPCSRAAPTSSFIPARGSTPIILSDESKVKDTSRVVRMPAGPVHDFPASNSQGLGIPKNAKNKKAAWVFIKWPLSPEISIRLVKNHAHPPLCPHSLIDHRPYHK